MTSMPVGGQPPHTPQAAPKTSGLAIAAFVCSLIPIFCTNIVGLGLGIAALVSIGAKPNELKGRGLAIAAVIIGPMWFVVGILAAIAIPNFIMFQAKAKQSEAKVNLKSIQVSEQAHYAEHGRYAVTFDELGWQPDGKTRYTYYLGASQLAPTEGPAEALPGLENHAEAHSFMAVAVANIDGDDDRDVWAIDEQGTLEVIHNDVGR